MDLSRALGQLADIHQQLAKGEIYRGYRSVPVAASGVIGIAAAWAQAPGLGAGDPLGFVLYWSAIAACAAFVGVSEILYNYIRDESAGRRLTPARGSRKPMAGKKKTDRNEDRGRFAYEGLERVLHEKARLGIMTSLVTRPEGLLFSELKRLCALTDGNLSRHLDVLREAGLLESWKGYQ